MKDQFVTYEIAKELKELGFMGNCFGRYFNDKNYYSYDYDMKALHSGLYSICAAPLWQQAIDFIHSKGIFISIRPEIYKDGINWNWQLFWYLPKEEWTYFTEIIDSAIENFYDGTFMYGDNHEYPTYNDAIKGCIEKAIEILKTKQNKI